MTRATRTYSAWGPRGKLPCASGAYSTTYGDGTSSTVAPGVHVSTARDLPRCLGDLTHGLEVALGGDREARLADVDAQPAELVADVDFLLDVQRRAGRLLAVAQRRVWHRASVSLRGLQGGVVESSAWRAARTEDPELFGGWLSL